MKVNGWKRPSIAFMVCAATLIAGGGQNIVAAQTFTVLHNFGATNGDLLKPVAPATIAQGPDGNLYSTTPNGGALNLGGVFKINPDGQLTIIYSFDGPHGAQPYSGLTLGQDGSLYGATNSGGSSGVGTVFKITREGAVMVLHNFAGLDGEAPYAAPIQGGNGNFYGVTYGGGSQGFGSIYMMTPSGKLATLHSFDETDGWLPYGPLVQGTDGIFYGTTVWGGTGGGGGTIFKITSNGQFTNLYNFDGTHGKFPYAGLVQASDGNLYGTTEEGGPNNTGVAFRISQNGDFTVIHDFNFNGNPGGSASFDGLLQATDGNLYGAPTEGGINDWGAIYTLGPKRFFGAI